jgi:hypothetical protein
MISTGRIPFMLGFGVETFCGPAVGSEAISTVRWRPLCHYFAGHRMPTISGGAPNYPLARGYSPKAGFHVVILSKEKHKSKRARESATTVKRRIPHFHDQVAIEFSSRFRLRARRTFDSKRFLLRSLPHKLFANFAQKQCLSNSARARFHSKGPGANEFAEMVQLTYFCLGVKDEGQFLSCLCFSGCCFDVCVGADQNTSQTSS